MKIVELVSESKKIVIRSVKDYFRPLTWMAGKIRSIWEFICYKAGW